MVTHFESKIPLPRMLGDFDNFASVRQPLFKTVGIAYRKMVSPQGDDQSMFVIQSPCDIDRVLTESRPALALGPVQFHTQSCKNLRAHRAVRFTQQAQRFLEQRYQDAIGGAGVTYRPASGNDSTSEQLELFQTP